VLAILELLAVLASAKDKHIVKRANAIGNMFEDIMCLIQEIARHRLQTQE
jgi:hypothetical protein